MYPVKMLVRVLLLLRFIEYLFGYDIYQKTGLIHEQKYSIA